MPGKIKQIPLVRKGYDTVNDLCKKLSNYIEDLFKKATKDVTKDAIFGKKLDYIFGLATGSQHNIDRSKTILSRLMHIGISDTPQNREYMSNILKKAFQV